MLNTFANISLCFFWSAWDGKVVGFVKPKVFECILNVYCTASHFPDCDNDVAIILFLYYAAQPHGTLNKIN